MPRRIEPIFGRDEVVEVRRAELTPEGRVRLLELLNPEAAARAVASSELDELATRYNTWRRQETGRPPRRRSIAALRALERAAKRLATTGGPEEELRVAAMLWGLCDHACLPFMLRLASVRRQAGFECDGALVEPDAALDRPDLIAAAARLARDDLSAQRGPDPDLSLHHAVSLLVELFERMTGRTATYGRMAGGDYSHGATSAAGRFIGAFFAEVDSKLPKSRPADSLRQIVAQRRQRRGSQLFTSA